MRIRPRRNRKKETIRSMVRENRLETAQLVYPLFIVDGENIKEEIKSLPRNFRFSLDLVLEEIADCITLGLNNFILFPAIDEKHKDSFASYSYSEDNFYLKGISAIKTKFPEICLISDVAMDPYNIDGHDGLVRNGVILNDESLQILGKMAVAQAKSGIDIIGPSDMMDGRIGFLRDLLDKEGFSQVSIMAYSAKYASAFYGPFRDALDSAPKSGDKKTYQLDPSNRKEGLREALLDEEEGADMVMIKPALNYLDVIKEIKQNANIPVTAYHVSGECAMLYAAAANGWLNFEDSMKETLISIKRAGADIIITYFAKDYAIMVKNIS